MEDITVFALSSECRFFNTTWGVEIRDRL